MPTVPAIEANGATIPAIGLGTWPMKGDECVEAVRCAIDAGYRHIDTAAAYGNEAEVGRGLRASGVDRDQIWVTTKVWWENIAGPGLRRSAEASLRALGLSRVDLLLVHWPNPAVPLADTIRALCAARTAGLTRHIGISNFPVQLMDEAMRLTTEPIVTNQIEFHPHLDQTKVMANARRHGMSITAYCPLGRSSVGGVLGEPIILEIAQRKKRTPAEVVLAWHLRQPGVIVVPKSASPERIRANISATTLALTDTDASAITALARPNGRIVNPAFAPRWD